MKKREERGLGRGSMSAHKACKGSGGPGARRPATVSKADKKSCPVTFECGLCPVNDGTQESRDVIRWRWALWSGMSLWREPCGTCRGFQLRMEEGPSEGSAMEEGGGRGESGTFSLGSTE